MKGTILRIAIIICASVIVVCAVFLVYYMVIIPQQTESTMSELRAFHGGLDTLASTDAVTETSETEYIGQETVLPEFQKLLEKNSDIVGWIRCDACEIDYPVMQCKEDQNKYLHLDFNQGYDYNGIPYLSKESEIRPQSQVAVLYGHNMKNGLMFGQLKKYKDIEFVRANPILEFDTLYERGHYKIIAVLHAGTNFEYEGWQYMSTEYSSDGFQDFMFQVRTRSYFQISDRCNETDRYLILSTCDYQFDGERLVIVCRKLDENEPVALDDYQVNPLVLMPKQYYSVYGGVAPAESALMENYNAFYG